MTSAEGEGSGEGLGKFPLEPGDHVLADRGYSHVGGIHEAHLRGAKLAVRFNPQGIRITDSEGGKFDLLEKLRQINQANQCRSWNVQIPHPSNHSINARLCVVRKSQEAINLAHVKLRRKAVKNGTKLRSQTLVYAEYVMVLSTFDSEIYPDWAVLEWYRVRWQVELVLKRFKQLAQLGHLPKHDDECSKAWLYGKLFVALLTEKIIDHARFISPWDIQLTSQRERSQWSEFKFMYRKVIRAIEPEIRLRELINGWTQVSAGLATPRCKESRSPEKLASKLS